MTPEEMYQHIHELSRPHITAYESDLEKIDYQWITETNAEKQREFIHITRGWGTWLAELKHRDDLPDEGVKIPYLFGHAGWRHIARRNIDSLQYYCSPDNKLWLHCTPKTGSIRHISAKEAEQMILKNYQDILAQNITRHQQPTLKVA